MSSPPDPDLICSFCGKSHRLVTKMFAGPSVYLCSECLGTMWEMLGAENLPPRVRTPAALPFARRDSIVVEVRRALEAAFPDRAAEILRDLEVLIPPGGPLICHDCRDHVARVPNPCPEDWVCPDWQEKTWTDLKFTRAEGIPPAWPWLLVLERRSGQANGEIDYVILAPLLLRRPVQLRAQLPPITDDRVY